MLHLSAVMLLYLCVLQLVLSPSWTVRCVGTMQQLYSAKVIAARGHWGTFPVTHLLRVWHRDGSGARALLLTGANMAGKSTLSRATCIAVILAQVIARILSRSLLPHSHLSG